MSKIYKRNCNNCKKHYIGLGKKYCSFECSNKATYYLKKKKMIHFGNKFWLGRKHNETTKEKIRLSRVGKYNGEENPHWLGGKSKPKCIDCGVEKGSWYGKRCIGCNFKFCIGENHPCWRGGTSERRTLYHRKENIAWRIAVFKRDSYTCQVCRQIGGKLQADHIKAWSLYPELRLDIDNGRTLCIECHKKTENYGSRVWKFLNKREVLYV